jgi:hypothetical protein
MCGKECREDSREKNGHEKARKGAKRKKDEFGRCEHPTSNIQLPTSNGRGKGIATLRLRSGRAKRHEKARKGEGDGEGK